MIGRTNANSNLNVNGELIACNHSTNANIDYTVTEDGYYMAFILPYFNIGSAYVKMGDTTFLNQTNIMNVDVSKYITSYSSKLTKGQTVKVQVVDTAENTYTSVVALFKLS